MFFSGETATGPTPFRLSMRRVRSDPVAEVPVSYAVGAVLMERMWRRSGPPITAQTGLLSRALET